MYQALLSPGVPYTAMLPIRIITVILNTLFRERYDLRCSIEEDNLASGTLCPITPATVIKVNIKYITLLPRSINKIIDYGILWSFQLYKSQKKDLITNVLIFIVIQLLANSSSLLRYTIYLFNKKTYIMCTYKQNKLT